MEIIEEFFGLLSRDNREWLRAQPRHEQLAAARAWATPDGVRVPSGVGPGGVGALPSGSPVARANAVVDGMRR
ncbi:hypothetical protein [Allonocardiopsis opalescens]|uniref:Uncharacterized protein n=1 Tax=Allonocardiopsis opalescens TaxID=1144618 RepID=A0A2T0Q5H9_9ACTN|nr:hypothetical protein [Allonocardiopsis opalescens]PRX99029.1 hypothetical protein CLV72_104609 [Allonocardiopsis opalescens]